jgi:hypothetical protein
LLSLFCSANCAKVSKTVEYVNARARENKMFKKLMLILTGVAALLSGFLIYSSRKSTFSDHLSKYTTVKLFAAAADAVCDCPPHCDNSKSL